MADDSGTSTLNLTVGAEASFTTALTATNLNTAKGSDTKFAAYGGTTSFTYKVRTTASGGAGAVTVAITAFAAGGPAVSDVTFSCTGGVGTECDAETAASTSAVNVITFGEDAHSADGGDSGSVVWSITDKPSYVTGSYSSTATFTISAT
jgi:hypothetical protein